MRTVSVLGVRLDNLTRAEINQTINNFLLSDNYHWLATINPEIVLHAYNQPVYCRTLNQSDLNIIDGVGINLIYLLQGKKLNHRYPGVDLIDYLASRARELNLKILIFGSQEKFLHGQHTALVAADKLKKKYPGLKISCDPYGKINQANFSPAADRIKQYGADILLVSLRNPIQEEFIYYLKTKATGLRLAIGSGGAVNMISGFFPRAPVPVRQMGLEWLWRLALEPRRIKRIGRAVLVFPGLVLFRKLFRRYRPGIISGIVNHRNEFLLAARQDDPQHWQMPAGGIEPGETAEQALWRELKAEVGIDRADISQVFCLPEKHKYHYSHHYLNHNFKEPFQGQNKFLFLLRYFGPNKIKVDQQELNNYRWVAANKLLRTIHPLRRGSAEKMLNYLDKLN